MARNEQVSHNNPEITPARTFTSFAPPVAVQRTKIEGIMDKSSDLEDLITTAMKLTGLGRADIGRQIVYAGLSYVGQELGMDIVLPDGSKKYQYVPVVAENGDTTF